MPKTFGIHLEIEEIALGTVLRKLNEMPGIAKIDLNLGHGGTGAGKEKLVQQASQMREKMRGENAEQAVVKLLVEKQGQMHIKEIASALGWEKQKAYGATHQLRKKGITEAGEGSGTHRLTRKAAQHIHGGKAVAAKAPADTPALPAPQVAHGPKGRAVPGSGNIILRNILGEGAKTPAEVRSLAAAQGMSPKSVSGVLDRARKGGLIKRNGNNGYELTAKGQKIETGVAAHG
ncbi:hypothetical protein KIP88_02470 [Bradyrhizobium sp. SRL28]|uniref:hypothetical protein n=1 Tax=Bradyrhizobium sp. SRL28 TaxID=2836178 RepID=UPI001BDE491E|nr:hypothetical protein [Bradyrhizobium sp. SRL28]MBT1509354.1 hypothetical protein [Bradyrhizobium sp. SRL28]